MSHPAPLPPADNLERALDDMRQAVAARGDEGLLVRVLTAQILLAVLGILDTLIRLLADFRAGRLPLLRSVDESSGESPDRRADETSSIATPRETASPDSASARHIRARRTETSGDAAATAPEQCGILAPRSRTPSVSSAIPSIRRPRHGQGGVASHPSVVPRWRWRDQAEGTTPRRMPIPLRYRIEKPSPCARPRVRP